MSGDGIGSGIAAGDAGATDAMVELRLTPDGARRLNEELLALVRRYTESDRSDEGPVNRLLLFASLPISDVA